MNTPILESKLPRVKTTVFSVMSALATQYNAVNLGQGFPDFECDSRLIDCVTQAMKEGHNQYPPMPGVLALRQRVSENLLATHGISYDPVNEITITAGATQGILSSILTVVRAGDEVIVLEPCYDSYIPNIELAGAKAVSLKLHPETFQPDFEALSRAINSRTRAIIVNTPHNPTGRIWAEHQWNALADILENRDIFVLSDEVYEHMVFDGARHISAGNISRLKDRSFVISSFGKTFHVTGWKIGTVCAPAALTAEFRKVHQFTVFTANSAMQHGIERYMKSFINEQSLSQFYQKKRDHFLAGLESTRFLPLPCEGSYFQCASYKNVLMLRDMNDFEVCEFMTKEIGVTPIPLSAFYSTAVDERIIRFCFAKRESTLGAAIEKLQKV